MSMILKHDEYCLQALAQAMHAQGSTAPNPAVGAVVVRADKIIASGYHQGPGCFHAERVALNQLSNDEARGSCVYVTLEPCCHYGRTPPCTDILIEKQVAKVVYCFSDPNPAVAGKSEKILQAAGISVEKHEHVEVNNFYESYAHWWRTGKPWVNAKLAISLDNKTAHIGGRPAILTGQQTNHFTHEKRHAADLILTTIDTVLADNPKLNARIGPNTYPKTVAIIDRNLQLPLDAIVIETAKKIILFFDKAQCLDPSTHPLAAQTNIQLIGLACDNKQHFILADLVHYLGEQGYHQVWVEAGARFFEALLTASLVNRAYLYIAPILLGVSAMPGLQGLSNWLQQVRQVNWQTSVGQDAILICDF